MTRRATSRRHPVDDHAEAPPLEVRVVAAEEDDPEVFERVARALARLLDQHQERIGSRR